MRTFTESMVKALDASTLFLRQRSGKIRPITTYTNTVARAATAKMMTI